MKTLPGEDGSPRPVSPSEVSAATQYYYQQYGAGHIEDVGLTQPQEEDLPPSDPDIRRPYSAPTPQHDHRPQVGDIDKSFFTQIYTPCTCNFLYFLLFFIFVLKHHYLEIFLLGSFDSFIHLYGLPSGDIWHCIFVQNYSLNILISEFLLGGFYPGRFS